MNRRETAEIVKLLTTYFRNTGTTSAGNMIDAWFGILKDYDFELVKEAVQRFARNDRRDYPTMPGVGQIVGAIEEVQTERTRPARSAFNNLVKGTDWSLLPPATKAAVNRDKYNMYLQRYSPEEIIADQKEIRADLIKKDVEVFTA